MGKTRRIPRSDEAFNRYVNTTTSHLLKTDPVHGSNWQRLGLSAAEKNRWVALLAAWNTAWNIVTTNSGRGIRDSVATKGKNRARNNLNTFLVGSRSNMLNRVASSINITSQDRVVFNIRLRSKTQGTKPAIDTSPMVNMAPVGSARVRITSRVKGRSGRPGLHQDAHTLEMIYCYLPLEATQPVSRAECHQSKLSTKAQFWFDVGMQHLGMRLCAYFRWRNITNKSKSGPWSNIVQVVIA